MSVFKVGDRVELYEVSNSIGIVNAVTLWKDDSVGVIWEGSSNSLLWYHPNELRLLPRVMDFVGTFQDAESGVTIVGVLIDGKVYKGTSKTCPREIFDAKVGELLAYSRALQRAADKAHAEASFLACEELPR